MVTTGRMVNNRREVAIVVTAGSLKGGLASTVTRYKWMRGRGYGGRPGIQYGGGIGRGQWVQEWDDQVQPRR